ncbi:MAG: FAD-dependent oxidoreductase [Solirubrobacterales bacterium]|nr:FAD-dependent oxidoreductase [Solirubrobacterales bacterium]
MARIAVIGAGVAGLTAAHTLQKEGHEVCVLEAEQRPGGHACTVAVGDEWVDMGFIVFNDRNYPHFTALLAELGVVAQPSDMSFAVTSERGGFEYSSASLGGLFATLPRPAFLRMLLDVRRFQSEAAELLDSDSDESLGDYLERNRYSRWFIDRLLIPQAAAVWSAPEEQMATFPARFLARFFHNHGMLSLKDRPQWFTVPGGSRTYVDALAARLDIRTGHPVHAIRRFADRVEVAPGGVFDEVVLACHADQALAMLADPSDDERQILGALPYQSNEAVLHTDRSLLPRRRRAWASWVYHLRDEPSRRSTVSYHMNRLQSLQTDQQVIVTVNRTEAIDPARILAVRHWSHPVFTAEGMAAQESHHRISGVRRTHYAGAYWRWGFHEDGAWSGLRAAASAGASATPELAAAA